MALLVNGDFLGSVKAIQSVLPVHSSLGVNPDSLPRSNAVGIYDPQLSAQSDAGIGDTH